MNRTVNFELAKLLKEKGFNEPCRFVYDNWNNIEDWYDIGREYHKNSEKNASVYYSAPTTTQVTTWLHNKHNIWISINGPHKLSKNWSYKVYKINDEITLNEQSTFNSPTETLEAAILYTLKNLI